MPLDNTLDSLEWIPTGETVWQLLNKPDFRLGAYLEQT